MARNWTYPEERKLAQYLKEGKTFEDCARLLDRTDNGIKHKKEELRVRGLLLAKRKPGPKPGAPMRRFTPQEDQIIRDDYASYVPVEEIAAKLDRSWGVIRQRILKLRLTRDSRRTVLVKNFGPDVLNLALDVDGIKAIIAQNMLEEQKALMAENQLQLKGILDATEAAVWNKTMTRAEAFAKAQEAGCSMESIGRRFGITRERVRQIIAKFKPRVNGFTEITCTRCGRTFTARSANRHYCDGCSTNVQRERHRIFDYKGGRHENRS